jgi:NAD-dependent SIR2 family protein deacetylase
VVVVCGVRGTLKPDVVFFGGTVAPRRGGRRVPVLDESEALLVVGSSLAVYSGFRFVRRASERALPIAVVNLGPTRADDMAHARLEAAAGDALAALADRI